MCFSSRKKKIYLKNKKASDAEKEPSDVRETRRDVFEER